jgi:RimJ/RimL family protein N-acetyltransferase
MNFELQPQIENEFVKIVPLKREDFEALYKIASDPLIWEQHPNKNRYQKEVFEVFFKGAIESKGAFIVYDTKTGNAIGSSRFYEWDETKKSISIGYTFFARNCWGKPYNKSLKALMLNHAFKFAETVLFHIGANNIRSQKAIEKLSAVKIAEEEMKYYGEQNTLNFIYKIEKISWQTPN